MIERQHGPDAEILSPPLKSTGPRRTDKGVDIPLRQRQGPVAKLGDDEDDGPMGLSPSSP